MKEGAVGWLKEILDENRRTVETWPEWKRRAGMSVDTNVVCLNGYLKRQLLELKQKNAQLKAELAQAKHSYDGAVAAHHEAKRQYRDVIEAHRRELAGWEAAHVALDRDLARCQKERDEACNVVAGANHLLLKAGYRAAMAEAYDRFVSIRRKRSAVDACQEYGRWLDAKLKEQS